MVQGSRGGARDGSRAGRQLHDGHTYSRDTVGREKPQHEVTFSQPFAVARHAVTHGQFAAFINNTNYRLTGGAHVPKDRVFLRHDPNASWLYPGFPQDDSHPVVCVNWHDANAYTAWLAQTAGKPYRLLSEAEREYVARAGTGTPFWWGASITPAQANYNPTGEAYESAGAKSDWRRATVPVGSFQANPWGLYQVHGNVTEWCEDVAHFNYYGAPTDGSAWLQGGDPSQRMARGGSWDADPMLLSCATRYDCPSDRRSVSMGFRVARAVIQ